MINQYFSLIPESSHWRYCKIHLEKGAITGKETGIIPTEKLDDVLADYEPERVLPDVVGIADINVEDVFLRRVTLPTMSPKQMQQALPFQLEQMTSFKSEDLIASNSVLNQTSLDTDINIFATLRTKYDMVTQKLRSVAFFPDRISTGVQGLYRFFSLKDAHAGSLVIDMKYETTVVVALSEEGVAKHVVFPFGLRHLCPVHSKDFVLGFHEKTLNIEEKMIKEQWLRTLLRFVETHRDEVKMQSVILSGYASFLYELRSLVTETIGLPMHSIMAELPSRDLLFAYDEGLCLDAMVKDQRTVTFSHVDFPSKRQKTQSYVYFAGSIISCLLIAFGGLTFFDYYQTLAFKQLKQEYKKLRIDPANKPIPAKSLNQFKKFLRKQTYQLSRQKYDVDLVKQPVLVTECLSVINQHVKKHQGKLLAMKYELIKFPSVKHPTAPFEIAVQCKFSGVSDPDSYTQSLKEAFGKPVKSIEVKDSEDGIEMDLHLSVR